LLQAKNKIVMLKVLRELTGKNQAFPAFGTDEPDILRSRRSIQVYLPLLIYCTHCAVLLSWPT